VPGACRLCADIFATLVSAAEPEALPPGLGKRAVYVDAEDGRRSGWCRYINHAHYETTVCNLEPRTDPSRALVWFEARRAISAGEELCFSCERHAGREWPYAVLSVAPLSVQGLTMA
jgi:hypothetical protein